MSSGKWDDLAPRLFSAVAMVGVGALGVWLGGLWFHALISIIVGLMVWELASMLETEQGKSALVLGAAAGLVAMVAIELPLGFTLPLLLVPSLLGFGRMGKEGVTYAVFTALILLAGYGLMTLRDEFGLVWVVWLLLVVMVTDIAGYFAGRIIGGPKLWPRVSPKKTWSGTVAGWASSVVVALLFAKSTQAGIGLVVVSIVMSMASQIGDISISAIKRRAGVKDSSNLIPGHGGLLDRFDGMLGAAVFIVIASLLFGFPPELS